MGSNPCTVYWMNIFSHLFAVKIVMFVWKRGREGLFFLKKMPWTFHLRNIFIQSVKRPHLAWPLLPNLAKANILSSLNEGCHMDEAGECSFPDWNLPQLFWHLRKSHKEAIETGFRPGRCWPNGHRARLRLHESEFKSHGSLLFLFSKIVCKDHA